MNLVPWSGHKPNIKRLESKIFLIHVLTASDETSQVWAVLKLFCIFLEERKKKNLSLLDLSASPQVKNICGEAGSCFSSVENRVSTTIKGKVTFDVSFSQSLLSTFHTASKLFFAFHLHVPLCTQTRTCTLPVMVRPWKVDKWLWILH